MDQERPTLDDMAELISGRLGVSLGDLGGLYGYHFEVSEPTGASRFERVLTVDATPRRGRGETVHHFVLTLHAEDDDGTRLCDEGDGS